MFAYCNNNPTLLVDPSGRFGFVAAVIVTGAIVGGLLGAFTAATTGGNILESAIEGVITGAIGAACGMLIGNPLTAIGVAFVGGAFTDIATQATSQYIRNGYVDPAEIDGGRVIKTASQTAMGTAIPQFGDAAKNAVDAFGTALIWTEGSTLIAAADVVVSNASTSKTKTPYQRALIYDDRKLLTT